MFRRAVLKDPLKIKQLAKGLDQLCEEGATQLFKPLRNNDMILGAVGQLQFEVVAFRLQDEYAVSAVFDTIGVHTARWVYCDDEKHSGNSAPRHTTTWRSIIPGRWFTSHLPASTSSSRSNAGQKICLFAAQPAEHHSQAAKTDEQDQHTPDRSHHRLHAT